MPYKIGTKEKPLVLKTPPQSSEFTMHVDQKDGMHRRLTYYVETT